MRKVNASIAAVPMGTALVQGDLIFPVWGNVINLGILQLSSLMALNLRHALIFELVRLKSCQVPICGKCHILNTPQTGGTLNLKTLKSKMNNCVL